MMNRAQVFFVFLRPRLFISLFLVLVSVYLPARIDSQEDLSTVALGWPIPYVTHDFSHYTPLVFPLWLPVWWLPFAGTILWLEFLLSWLLITVILILGSYLAKRF